MNITKFFIQKKYVIAIAVFCSILWGSAFPVLKLSYAELNILPEDTMTRIVFAGMRFFLASIIIFVIYKVTIKKSLKIKKSEGLQLFKLGMLQTAIFYFLFYTGVANTTGVKSAILDSSSSFFIILFAHYAYKDDKINRKKIIGLILGFLGIICVNWGKDFNLNLSFFGEGFMLISGILFGFSTIYAKKLSLDIHPFLLTAWQMFFGSIVLLTVGIIGTKGILIDFTLKGGALLVYSSFLSATAFSLWYSLLKYNKAGEISIYKFVNPLAGSILSTIFIPGETFSLYIILALILVVLGIIVINYKTVGKK